MVVPFTDYDEAKRNRERLERIRTLENQQIKKEPQYRRSVKGYKRGHYPKTATKIDEVIELYNQGKSLAEIASQLHLAENSISGIIKEQVGKTINLEESEKRRKLKNKLRMQGDIIRALKGIASSGKSNGWELEKVFDHAYKVFENYLKREPERTVRTLMGDKTFTAEDLILKVETIVLSQCLRLDDRFEEVDEDTFKLVE